MNKIQKHAFLRSEGDQWYQRNKENIKAQDKVSHDEIFKCIDFMGLDVKVALEIGCSNGWRLQALYKKYKAKCFGIEPSKEAVLAGKKQFPRISLRQGTADRLPWRGGNLTP